MLSKEEIIDILTILYNLITEKKTFLLKYISNGKIIQILSKEEIKIIDKINDEEILDGINNFLDNCLKLNNLNLENIFEKK